MNREIRFRQAIYFNGIFSEFHYWGFVNNNNEIFNSPQCNNQNAYENSTQFTGLKDKNGVCIYEGDILKWGHVKGYSETPIRIAEIKMPCGQIEFHSQVGIFYFGSFMYSDSLNKCSEVIGNIFENPELL